ncbi:ABC transporter permease [Hymenobacter negativus]|uniref:ABC transporter permease n=1 Tax=Hymenobacter negativus TaxID=2795026 RepID=A0ABS3QAC3_9BACT|nr:ABC transporter permease [Hymenobacter negativus]MBO2007779.1 ABC transporter permease [Hymenobacter negativus]
MKETIYTSQSPLHMPRAFLREVRADLGVVYRIGWQLFVRNLKVQVRQSLLGYAWLLLPPLVTGLVWVLLGRTRVLNVESDSVPYPAFVLAGVFLWQGFVEALGCPLQQLTNAKATLAKVRVPHEAFVTAGAAVVVFNSLLRLGVLLGLMLWFGVPLTGTLALVPLGLAALLLLGLALGWLLALLGLLYADVAQALPVVLNLWFLITPVVYLPPAAFAKWFNLNPVTPLLSTTRNWLLAGPVAPASGFGLVAGLGGIFFLLTWLAYRLAQPHLVARL